LTPAAALAAAANSGAETKERQVCEANFYTGELNLLNGAKADAVPLLRAAAASCPKDFAEYAAALAELKALGLDP
jgi:lipoprotein NlpI